MHCAESDLISNRSLSLQASILRPVRPFVGRAGFILKLCTSRIVQRISRREIKSSRCGQKPPPSSGEFPNHHLSVSGNRSAPYRSAFCSVAVRALKAFATICVAHGFAHFRATALLSWHISLFHPQSLTGHLKITAFSGLDAAISSSSVCMPCCLSREKELDF